MLSVEALLDSIPDDAESITVEQFVNFLRVVHILLRQVRLCYEYGTDAGNRVVDEIISGFGTIIEEFELEETEREHEKRKHG